MFWECKMVQSLWKIVWCFLKKSKTRIILWFSSPLFWHVCMLSPSVMSDSLQPHGLSLGFSRQEYWSGLPFPPPRDLPHPGIEPTFPVAPALADEFCCSLLLEPPGRPHSSGSFFFNFIFKLYIIVLVLLNIKMNPPQVCMCSPSWTLLPPPSPYHPSGSSQCTSPKHPVSWRTKSRTLKRYINVHCNIIHNSQEVEEIYVFLSRLMHKQNCHIHTTECYSAFKRREILTYHAI